MTAPSADTAELPAVRDTAMAPVIAPGFAPPAPPVPVPPASPRPRTSPSPLGTAISPRAAISPSTTASPPGSTAPAPRTGRPAPGTVAGRAAVQVERRQARRQRRLLGALGVLVLAATLLLTVAVLDIVH